MSALRSDIDSSVGAADISFRKVKFIPSVLFEKIHWIPNTLYKMALQVFLNTSTFPWHRIMHYNMYRIEDGTIVLNRYLRSGLDGDVFVYNCSGDEYRNVAAILDGVCGEVSSDFELLACEGDNYYKNMYFVGRSPTIKFIKQLHKYRCTLDEAYNYTNLEENPGEIVYIFFAHFPLYSLAPGEALNE